MPQPHVLVISHNVFSASGNMGKTMENLLGGVDPAHLAQLYFHSEVPTRRCCLRYFRITDRDVLRSRLSRRQVGRSYGADDIDETRTVSRTDRGLEAVSTSFRAGGRGLSTSCAICYGAWGGGTHRRFGRGWRRSPRM